MPSKMQQRIQHARDREVFVFRVPPELRVNNRISWTVYVNGEWSYRGCMTKREAKNLAYAISISKKTVLTVTVYDNEGNVVSQSKS